MRVAIFDRVEPPVPAELPLRIAQTCSHRRAAVKLVLAAPAMLTVAVATLILLLHAAVMPAARAAIAQHPLLVVEILAALAFWSYLLGLPLKRLFDRSTLRRAVEIDHGNVTVTESRRKRSRSWSQPLKSFTGLTHHVRASLSGTRHELILVHPERKKSVLVSLAATMSQTEVDRVAALLGQKVISPRALYRFDAPLSRNVLPTWRNVRVHEPVQKIVVILGQPLTRAVSAWLSKLKGQRAARGERPNRQCLSSPGGSQPV